MNLFSRLKSAFSGVSTSTTSAADPIAGTSSWRVLLTAIGVTSPTCPHCGFAFEKMPSRKRSCPKCGNIFYSRKRALDGIKVLLTEAEARNGEAQDAIVTLAQDGVGDSDLDALVSALREQLGRVPTADEILVVHWVGAAAAHAEARHWGLYRNARFSLAESCVRRGLPEDALRLFLEVSIIDLNGPRNCGTRDPEALRRFPPFDPKTALLAPGVIGCTVDVIAELKFSSDEVRGVFESVVNAVCPALNLPRSPSATWEELSKALGMGQR
jgi:hypothetical protein